MASATQSQACRVALAMGLDVSASVDAQEYRLQVDGVAAALNAPSVQDVLLRAPGGPVALSVYEWSGWEDQRVLLEWTVIEDAGDLSEATRVLQGTVRQEMSDSTALGRALLTGASLLQRAPPCARQVLDISGDGKNNDGADPDMVQDDPNLAGITVNALAIGADDRTAVDLRAFEIGELSSYFRTTVIRGPNAFVEAALGFSDFERAMTRKLLRELRPAAMSGIRSPQAPHANRAQWFTARASETDRAEQQAALVP